MSDVVGKNKVVEVTYTLRNERGETVDIRDLPVAYVHGSGTDIFPRVEQALEGRTVGERITVTLAPAECFGERDPRLSFTDDVENVPPQLRVIGQQFEAANSKGEVRTFVVTRIENGRLTVDANHPLAGQTITFDVRIETIRDATPDEIRAGRPDSGPATLQ